jgi:hydroxymethylglutaryl-CoA reductase
VPRAMGLGSSAAVTVALVRAIAGAMQVPLDDAGVAAIAQECETLSHGEASDLDLVLEMRGTPITYRLGPPREIRPLRLPAPISLVIGTSGRECLTAAMIRNVKQGVAEHPARYRHIFDEMDAIAREAADLLENGDLPRVGGLMNLCHGMLNALQVSTWEIEEMVDICRRAGALGAKLTGEGGGGSVVALCTESGDPQNRVADSLRHRGYGALVVTLP